jgi:NTP pyrophosphatase (non-canonical NTP hydrolase)
MSDDFSIGSKKWPGISKLIEEAGEVIQVCGKLIGSRGDPHHWDGSNLKLRLEDELGDLVAAVGFVIERNGLNEDAVERRSIEKHKLFWEWQGEPLEEPGSAAPELKCTCGVPSTNLEAFGVHAAKCPLAGSNE